MTPINPPSNRRDAGHKHDAPPPVPEHVRHTQLRQEEGGLQVDAERVLELLERDVEDVGDAAPVARVSNEDVRPGLPMLRLEV